MAGLLRSTLVILLSLVAVLSSTAASIKSDSSPLDRGQLIDGLATGFDDDDTAKLMDDEEPKRAMFRSDLGKRDDEDRKIRTLRALSRYRSFKTDLGKKTRLHVPQRSGTPVGLGGDR